MYLVGAYEDGEMIYLVDYRLNPSEMYYTTGTFEQAIRFTSYNVAVSIAQVFRMGVVTL